MNFKAENKEAKTRRFLRKNIIESNPVVRKLLMSSKITKLRKKQEKSFKQEKRKVCRFA